MNVPETGNTGKPGNYCAAFNQQVTDSKLALTVVEGFLQHSTVSHVIAVVHALVQEFISIVTKQLLDPEKKGKCVLPCTPVSVVRIPAGEKQHGCRGEIFCVFAVRSSSALNETLTLICRKKSNAKSHQK